jgi:hypothetical protein
MSVLEAASAGPWLLGTSQKNLVKVKFLKI